MARELGGLRVCGLGGGAGREVVLGLRRQGGVMFWQEAALFPAQPRPQVEAGLVVFITEQHSQSRQELAGWLAGLVAGFGHFRSGILWPVIREENLWFRWNAWGDLSVGFQATPLQNWPIGTRALLSGR